MQHVVIADVSERGDVSARAHQAHVHDWDADCGLHVEHDVIERGIGAPQHLDPGSQEQQALLTEREWAHDRDAAYVE